jgi:hypothetical protein
MNTEKKYYGNGKETEFNDGGKLLKLSFSKDDLLDMLQNLNDRGYINLNVNRRREPSQYGHTHSIMLDTWKPNTQGQAPRPQSQTQQPRPQNQHGAVPTFSPPPMPDFNEQSEDDVPF